MRTFWKAIGSVVLCEAVGILGSVFTFQSIPQWYAFLQKPFFSPPNWLFGPVWTLLYFLMGISLYLLLTVKTKKKLRKEALTAFGTQLFFNFIWTPVFFGARQLLVALFIILLMWGAIVWTMLRARKVSPLAAWLLLPYLGWVSFATLLNAAIFWLNR